MKRLFKLVVLLLVVLGMPNVYASTNTFDRNTLDNYGVNKKWQINDSNKNNVLNTKAVDASEKIYDFANILTDEEERQLKEEIDNFTRKYNMDLVIVTDNYQYPESMKSYCYSDTKADDEIYKYNDVYAGDFYDYNDFGIDLPNYSGIMIFRNTAIDPCFNAMYYDMYTFGDAQLYFDQSRYDSILDGIYNNMKGENYLVGFKDFINRASTYVSMGRPSGLNGYTIDDNGFLKAPPVKYRPPIGIALLMGLIAAGITIAIMVAKNRMVKKAYKAEEYLDKESINITNRQDIYLRSHTTSYTISSSSGGGHGGGGFSSHGGSSGGGHSSGGGRHG